MLNYINIYKKYLFIIFFILVISNKSRAQAVDTIYIGNSHLYKSLTNTGGLFQAINNDTLSRPLYIIIDSDLTETGLFPLNKTYRVNNSLFPSYNISIIAAKNKDITISGNNSNGIIRFNGVDSVYFGNTNTNSKITVVNNAINDTAAVFKINASSNSFFSSENIHISNTIIESNKNSKLSFGIVIGSINLKNQTLNKVESTQNIFITNNEFKNQKFGIFYYKIAINSSLLKNLQIANNSFNSIDVANFICLSDVADVEIVSNIINITNFRDSLYLKFSISESAISFFKKADNVLINGNKINIISNSKSYFTPIGINIIYVKSSGILISNNIINNTNDVKPANESKQLNYNIYIQNSENIKIYSNTLIIIIDFANSVNNIRVINSKNTNIMNNSIQVLSKTSPLSSFNHIDFISELGPVTYRFTKINNNHFENSYLNNIVPNYLMNPFLSLEDFSAELRTVNKNIVGCSDSKNASFKSTTNILHKKGTKLEEVPYDIDGRVRSSTPSIGAYELDSVPGDIEIAEMIFPNSCIDTGSSISELKVLLKNNTTSFLKNFSFKVSNTDTFKIVNVNGQKLIHPYSSDTITLILDTPLSTSSGKLKINLHNYLDANVNNDTISRDLTFYVSNYNSFLDSQTYFTTIGSSLKIIPNDPLNRNILFYDKPNEGNLIYIGKELEKRITKNSEIIYLDLMEKDRLDSISIIKNNNFAGSKGFYISIKNTNNYPIGIHTISNTSFTLSTTIGYKIYSKSGDYAGFELNANAWTLIKTGSAKIGSSDRTFYMPLDDNLIIQPGQTYSFYVRCTTTTFNRSFYVSDVTNGVFSRSKNGVTIGFGISTTSDEFTGTLIQNRNPQIQIFYNRTGLCMKSPRTPVLLKSVAGQIVTFDAKLEPITNVKKYTGTSINPDIICGALGSNFSYRIFANDSIYENNYGNNWKVLTKKLKKRLPGFVFETISFSNDTSRTFILSVPTNASFSDEYSIDYSVQDLINGDIVYFTRYITIPKINTALNIGSNRVICKGDSVKLKSNIINEYFYYQWSNGDTKDSTYIKTEGYHKLRVSYEDCSYIEDSVYVDVDELQDSLTMVITPLGNCEYQFAVSNLPTLGNLEWDFGDKTILLARTAKHKFAKDSTYRIVVKLKFSMFNCVEKELSIKYLTTNCFTGLESENYSSRIKVFPIPATNTLYIESDLKIDEVFLYDLSGRILTKTHKKELNLNEFANGLYFIHIKTEHGIVVRKIQKE